MSGAVGEASELAVIVATTDTGLTAHVSVTVCDGCVSVSGGSPQTISLMFLKRIAHKGNFCGDKCGYASEDQRDSHFIII
jgi:hypothetical protein